MVNTNSLEVARNHVNSAAKLMDEDLINFSPSNNGDTRARIDEEGGRATAHAVRALFGLVEELIVEVEELRRLVGYQEED